MKIKILRQSAPKEKSYWQIFDYEKKDSQTVAGMLDELNYKDDLKDASGNPAPRIQWDCSCLQGMCGACAMVINHKPALACETFLRDLKGDTVILEPLKKFPVIIDLVVDRSVIQENLKKANAYIESFKGADKAKYAQMYSIGKCLKCGLCLEVCPNYKNGANFYGATFANDCFLISSRSKTQEKNIKEEFLKHFESSCSKSLSCADVCPIKIQTLASIAKMNR